MSFLTANVGETEEAQVTVQGTLRDVLDSEMVIFTESLTAAYKYSFMVTGNAHFSVKGRCTKCPPDDDVTEAGILAVVRKVGW
jgi:hypothetical protein